MITPKSVIQSYLIEKRQALPGLTILWGWGLES